MRRLRLFTYDDVDCAHVWVMRATKAKRGIRAAREFFKMVSAAHAGDEVAAKAAMKHRLWSGHCVRLALMRRSGELDRINKRRACTGTFFREHNLRQYAEWRKEQRDWLNA